MLVLGIGHPFRGDDAAGPRVAQALAGTPGLNALEHHGEGADLMERWQGHDPVVIVDAMVSGAAPGTVRVWDAIAEPLPARLFPKGSHLFGLAEAVEMARMLGRLPPRLTVYGIEGATFSLGAPMSAEVAAAVNRVVAEIAGRTI